MDEYRDGLLLFELMEQEIWNKSKSDTLGLQAFYESNKGNYQWKKRYDVTILINGLPLCQIELKRSGLELKEAFNQTLRYKRHSYSSNNALFNSCIKVVYSCLLSKLTSNCFLLSLENDKIIVKKSLLILSIRAKEILFP